MQCCCYLLVDGVAFADVLDWVQCVRADLWLHAADGGNFPGQCYAAAHAGVRAWGVQIRVVLVPAEYVHWHSADGGIWPVDDEWQCLYNSEGFHIFAEHGAAVLYRNCDGGVVARNIWFEQEVFQQADKNMVQEIH